MTSTRRPCTSCKKRAAERAAAALAASKPIDTVPKSTDTVTKPTDILAPVESIHK